MRHLLSGFLVLGLVLPAIGTPTLAEAEDIRPTALIWLEPAGDDSAVGRMIVDNASSEPLLLDGIETPLPAALRFMRGDQELDSILVPAMSRFEPEDIWIDVRRLRIALLPDEAPVIPARFTVAGQRGISAIMSVGKPATLDLYLPPRKADKLVAAPRARPEFVLAAAGAETEGKQFAQSETVQ